jgi:polyisoprenyl-phosphate glycosyltransferase
LTEDNKFHSGTRLSVVVPACNERDNIEPLVRRLQVVLSKLDLQSDIIIVDDGSRDGTWDAILRAAAQVHNVKGLRLSRNFGHQNALWAGLSMACGDAVITMDGDLQHPPEVIPELVAEWRKGNDIVHTRRLDAGVTSWPKRLTSKYFYKFFSYLSDFRLLDRRPLDILLGFDDNEPFIRGAVEWLGFRSTTIHFQIEQRQGGQSKYNLKRLVRFAITGAVSFSNKPLRLGIWVGIVTSILAFTELLYILMQYLSGKTVEGWASTLGIISFLFGILFIILGIIGVYIAQIHKTLQRRPRFIIHSTTGSFRDQKDGDEHDIDISVPSHHVG